MKKTSNTGGDKLDRTGGKITGSLDIEDILSVKGKQVLDEDNCVAIYEGGLIDPDTTLYELILTRHENTPDSGTEFYYIRTMFYSSKSVTSNRAQIAYAYRKNQIAYRYYYSGKWSKWVIYEESEWQEVSDFLNGWVNYGESFPTAGYKKNGKLVYLKGLIKSGTVGTNAFKLPAGYQPITTRIFSGIASSGTLAEIRIEKSGYVTITRGSSTWTSLDGISYYLDDAEEV